MKKKKGLQNWLFCKFIIAIYQAIFLIPALLWYRWVMPSWGGNGILSGIFDNTISLGQTIYILKYHLTTMFPIILLHPAVIILFLLGIWTLYKKKILTILPMY